MAGVIAGVLMTGIVGILFVVLGCLVWRKEMLTLLHDYHVDKVTPENRKAFCTLSGIGLLVTGIGLLATAVLFAFTQSAASFLCFAAAFAAGLGLLVTAVHKYNR